MYVYFALTSVQVLAFKWSGPSLTKFSLSIWLHIFIFQQRYVFRIHEHWIVNDAERGETLFEPQLDPFLSAFPTIDCNSPFTLIFQMTSCSRQKSSLPKMSTWHFNFGQLEFAYWHDPDHVASLSTLRTHMGWVTEYAGVMLQMLCKDSAALGRLWLVSSLQLSPPRPRAPAFTRSRSRSRVWGWVASDSEWLSAQLTPQPGSIQPSLGSEVYQLLRHCIKHHHHYHCDHHHSEHLENRTIIVMRLCADCPPPHP